MAAIVDALRFLLTAQLNALPPGDERTIVQGYLDRLNNAHAEHAMHQQHGGII